MRIPVTDAAKVERRPLGTQFTNTNFDVGAGDVGRAVAGLGQAAEDIQGAMDASAARADAVMASEALSRYQHDTTSVLDGNAEGASTPEDSSIPRRLATGVEKQGQLDAIFNEGGKADETPPPSAFLSSRGLDAGAQSAAALEYLHKRRRDIGEALKSERAREIYKQQSRKLFESSRARVESHVSREREVAEQAAVEGRMSTALTAIANNYSDEQGAASAAAAGVEESIRAFNSHLGEDAVDAKVGAWRQKVTEVRLDQYLSAKDWKGAEKLFDEQGDQLGAGGVKYKRQISTMRADAEAQGVVDGAVAKHRDPVNNRVDTTAAEAEVAKMPPGPLRDEAQQRLDPALAREERAWKQEVDTHFSRAFGAYYDGGGDLGAISAEDKAWLIHNAPTKWREILHEEYGEEGRDRAKRSAARAGAKGGESEDQRQALVEFKADLFAHPEKYKGMTPESFAADWRGRLSPGGYSRAGDLYARTQKEGKGKSSNGSAEFRAFVSNEVKGTPALEGKSHKKQADQFQALMGDEFFAFTERNPGKTPTAEEMRKMRDSVWETRSTWFGLSSEQALKKRTPPTGATKSKLAPGAYKDGSGKVWIVDAQGNKTLKP